MWITFFNLKNAKEKIKNKIARICLKLVKNRLKNNKKLKFFQLFSKKS